MSGERLIPQFTMRSMLAWMTAAVVLVVIGGWAYQDAPFAVVLLLAILWLVVALLGLSAVGGIVWFWAQLRPPGVDTNQATPFAGEELPPQWVVPEDPE